MVLEMKVLHGLQLSRQINNMLITIAIILGILWFLGIVTAHTIGGFIHILIVIVIVIVLIRIIRGQKVV